MGINLCPPNSHNKQNGEQQLGINSGSPNGEQQLGINLGLANGRRQMGINPCPPIYLMDLTANDNWASTQVHQMEDDKWASTHVHRVQPVRPRW